MPDSKLRIELHSRTTKNNNILVCVGIGGGIATKHYMTNTGEQFTLNRSFFNVLFNYMRKHTDIKTIRFDVQRTESLIYFSAKKANLTDTLSKIISMLCLIWKPRDWM